MNLPSLVMTNSLTWYRWTIEIDGLPGFTKLKNGGSFHGKLLNNQMVPFGIQTWQWKLPQLSMISLLKMSHFHDGGYVTEVPALIPWSVLVPCFKLSRQDQKHPWVPAVELSTFRSCIEIELDMEQ